MLKIVAEDVLVWWFEARGVGGGMIGDVAIGGQVFYVHLNRILLENNEYREEICNEI